MRTLKWNLYVNPTYLKVHFSNWSLWWYFCKWVPRRTKHEQKHSVIRSVRGPEHAPSVLKTLNALRILKSLCSSETKKPISFSSYEHFIKYQRILFFFFVKHLTFQEHTLGNFVYWKKLINKNSTYLESKKYKLYYILSN